MSLGENKFIKTVSAIVGIIVACIAIFTFITGISSLNLLGQQNGPASQQENLPSNPTQPKKSPVEATDTFLPQTPSPRMYNFTACAEPCNGGNSISTFSPGITKIYLEWYYENIPYGASYIRKWTMSGREWIKYDCTWTGSKSGRESVKLTEPKGLHSGTWELTVIVDGDVLLDEQIKVSGNWDYWDPAGTINNCYGTTD